MTVISGHTHSIFIQSSINQDEEPSSWLFLALCPSMPHPETLNFTRKASSCTLARLLYQIQLGHRVHRPCCSPPEVVKPLSLCSMTRCSCSLSPAGKPPLMPGTHHACIGYLRNNWPKGILPNRAGSKYPVRGTQNRYKALKSLKSKQLNWTSTNFFLETKGRSKKNGWDHMYNIQRTGAQICQVQTGEALQCKARPGRWMNTLNELGVTGTHILNLRQYSGPNLRSPMNCMSLGRTALTQATPVLDLTSQNWIVINLHSNYTTRVAGSAQHPYSVITIAGKNECRKSLIKDIKVL